MKISPQAFRDRITKNVKDILDGVKLPVRKTAGDVSDGTTVLDEQFSISKYLRGALKCNWSDADYEHKRFVETNKQFVKALNEGTGTAGSFLVTPEFSSEIIELLRAKAVVRSLGPTIYPMKSDTLNIPRQDSGATAYWTAENASKTPSEQTFGEFQLVLKKVIGLVKCSDELLEDASPAVDVIIKSDLTTVLSLAEDLAFIQGTGGTQPLGVYNHPSIPSVTLGGGNGAIITYDDLLNAMYNIELNNGTASGWIMHPRTKNTLRKLKDMVGNYIYTDGNVQKAIPSSLFGLPCAFSTQIPITNTYGTSGATASYAILGNWAELAVGEKSSGITFLTSNTAGESFQYDQTWFRAVRRVDCGVRQPNEFYIIKGITT